MCRLLVSTKSIRRTGGLPYLCINPIETEVYHQEELVGKRFEVKSLEEANEREDSFYVFEHEPLENYELIIHEFKDSHAHITCTGTVITDGYAAPYTTAEITIDCWLPSLPVWQIGISTDYSLSFK